MGSDWLCHDEPVYMALSKPFADWLSFLAFITEWRVVTRLTIVSNQWFTQWCIIFTLGVFTHFFLVLRAHSPWICVQLVPRGFLRPRIRPRDPTLSPLCHGNPSQEGPQSQCLATHCQKGIHKWLTNYFIIANTGNTIAGKTADHFNFQAIPEGLVHVDSLLKADKYRQSLMKDGEISGGYTGRKGGLSLKEAFVDCMGPRSDH